MPLKTLFLNPPSFENFDGGASSRWPATREIESYWYPVWLAYPAGMLEGSKLLDAPPHHVSADETIEIAKGFDFLVLFTSTVGWSGDHGLARAIRNANPSIKIAFVGPPVTTDPDRALNECEVIDFVCRREFDFSVVEYANGTFTKRELERLIAYRAAVAAGFYTDQDGSLDTTATVEPEAASAEPQEVAGATPQQPAR